MNIQRAIRIVVVSLSIAAMSCGPNTTQSETPDPRDGGATFARQESANICVKLESCLPEEWASGVWTGSIRGCTSNDSGAIPLPGTIGSAPILRTGLEDVFGDLYRCVAEAEDGCESVRSCFSRTGDPTCTGGGDGLNEGTCDGSVLEGCTRGGVAFSVDCASYGLECGESGSLLSEFTGCVLGACPSQTACLEQGVAQVCLGDGSSVQHLMCGELTADAECRLDAQGVPTCGSTTECDGEQENTCDGASVVQCRDGQLFRRDCSNQPTQRRCEGGSCTATGTECDHDEPVCEGDVLRFCQDGYEAQVDCRDAGLTNCENGTCVEG